ncbi:MAG: hypothetical protein RBR63_04245 [Methanosarcina vacuolata]|nr:hypothetical protein [Methanosarcina vacuolata]
MIAKELLIASELVVTIENLGSNNKNNLSCKRIDNKNKVGIIAKYGLYIHLSETLTLDKTIPAMNIG